MSSYIHFFLRKGNEFAPIGSFTSSSLIYRIFHCSAPYNGVRSIEYLQLKCILEDINKKINRIKDNIAAAGIDKTEILAANNDLASKLDYINEHINPYIADVQMELDEASYAANFVQVIKDILDEASCAGLDIDNYLYVGIECGYNITVDDIVKEPQD